mmetsp:Transcript_48467/g.90744  ORF Transcript_48467/g.90744 Transcript_48467/m.90744 type:complete len:115 (+) Transcript_48467:135-479(+)
MLDDVGVTGCQLACDAQPQMGLALPWLGGNIGQVVVSGRGSAGAMSNDGGGGRDIRGDTFRVFVSLLSASFRGVSVADALPLESALPAAFRVSALRTCSEDERLRRRLLGWSPA